MMFAQIANALLDVAAGAGGTVRLWRVSAE